MKILKVLNNNAVVLDDKGEEVVGIGNGIGFQKKVGTLVEKSKISKIYKLPKKHLNHFEQLVANIPYEHIGVADEIITYAKNYLNNNLSQHIYITLTDHINFALERKQQNINIENALLLEIKSFYPKEFEVGLKAIEIIHEKLNLKLDEDEAGFIALHLVNAQSNNNLDVTVKLPKILKDIIEIVEKHFNIKLDINAIYYKRFLTHLKFLLQRIVNNENLKGKDKDFYIMYLSKYKKSAKCAKDIEKYIKSNLQYDISTEELMYLTMHIERISKR